MKIKCKRIIDGKTYNTETATQLTGFTECDEPVEVTEYLYQNRFGAFFLYRYVDTGHAEYDKEEIIPQTPDQAREWLEKRENKVDLIELLFGKMPEAGEVKFTLRIPESLRHRLAMLARENNQSLNAWIVRCLESCATPQTPPQSGM